MLLGCGGNHTSSLIDDESASTSSAYVDSQKRHLSLCSPPPIGSLRRGAIYLNVYVNDRYSTTCLPDYKCTWHIARLRFGLFESPFDCTMPGALALIQSLRCGACPESGFVILG